MKNISYLPHKISLFALFTLGETVILLPFENSTEKTIIAFVVAAIIGAPLLILMSFLLKKAGEIKYFKKVVIPIFCSFFIIYSLYLAVNTFNVFIDFVKAYVLTGVSKLFAAMVFSAVVVALCITKRSVLYKFGFVTVIASAALIVVLFCFSWGQFSVHNISLFSMPKLTEVFSESMIYLKAVILPTLILLFFEEEYNKTEDLTVIMRGYFLGFFLHLVCLLNSLLIFGTKLSSKFDFAYSEAIATVTAGNIFTRMDGFSYFVFFITCLVKITVCLKISSVLIKKLWKIKGS